MSRSSTSFQPPSQDVKCLGGVSEAHNPDAPPAYFTARRQNLWKQSCRDTVLGHEDINSESDENEGNDAMPIFFQCLRNGLLAMNSIRNQTPSGQQNIKNRD